MANTVKIKRSAVPSKVPVTNDLELGELAINTFDGKLFTKKDNGTISIIEIGGGSAASTPDPIVVNDISTQFDGTKSVFDLRVNQDYIADVGDSKDIEVIVNGARLAPYIGQIRWPWFSPYDSFKGFRVIKDIPEPNTVKLVLYNAPFVGDSASVMVRTNSSSKQQSRYPFSVSTIALGD